MYQSVSLDYTMITFMCIQSMFYLYWLKRNKRYITSLEEINLENKKIKKYNDSPLNKIQSICEYYDTYYRILSRDANKINSKYEVISLLEKHAKMNAIKENRCTSNHHYTNEEWIDYEKLENYRLNELVFIQTFVEKSGYPLRLFLSPGIHGFITFSTFHWAIHMVIENCSYPLIKETNLSPTVYKFIDDSDIYTYAMKQQILQFRNNIEKEFTRIQNDIFTKDN